MYMHRARPCYTFFPYTTLFRSRLEAGLGAVQETFGHIARPFLREPLGIAARAVLENAFARFEAQVQAVVVGVTLLRSEEHTSELQSLTNLVCRLLLE